MKKRFSVLVLCAIAVLGCKDPSNRIPEIPSKKMLPTNFPKSKAGDIVKNAIEFSGGWNEWRKKKTLSYVKQITFFDSLGNPQRQLKQLHQYQLQPNFNAKISWDEDGDHYEIINNGKEVQKIKNGLVMPNEPDVKSAWNSTFGSHYVMCMPFKLADSETILDYQGLDTLSNKQIVHSIKTTYTKNAGSSGGLHTWWYYFDKDTFEPTANFLDYGDGFSYTQNDEFQNVDGIKMNKKRSSYKSNSNRDLSYKGTEYTNEDIVFNVTFDKDLFNLKDE